LLDVEKDKKIDERKKAQKGKLEKEASPHYLALRKKGVHLEKGGRVADQTLL